MSDWIGSCYSSYIPSPHLNSKYNCCVYRNCVWQYVFLFYSAFVFRLQYIRYHQGLFTIVFTIFVSSPLNLLFYVLHVRYRVKDEALMWRSCLSVWQWHNIAAYTVGQIFLNSFEPFIESCRTVPVFSLSAISADHSCRAVWGMNHLHPLEHWDRVFESRSRHGYLCVRLFCVCLVLCIVSGLATGWSTVQGILSTVYTIKNLKKRPRSTRAVEP
jgi:hypothetical protein